MLGGSATASIESGIAVNTQFIVKAVESTNHNLNEDAVLENLDHILAKEVDMGCFMKVGDDQYKISHVATATFDSKTGELIPEEIGKSIWRKKFHSKNGNEI